MSGEALPTDEQPIGRAPKEDARAIEVLCKRYRRVVAAISQAPQDNELDPGGE